MAPSGPAPFQDVARMVRALEDFLTATAPKPKPQPEPKTPAERTLERLLEELAKAPPPQERPPQPKPARPIPVAQAVKQIEAPPPAEPLAPAPVAQVVPETPPPAKPIPPPLPVLRESPAVPAPAEAGESKKIISIPRGLLFALLSAAVAAPFVLQRPPRQKAPLAPARRLPAQPAPAPAATSAPQVGSDSDRAISLVLAYRPSPARITVGDVFASIAGGPVPAADWELKTNGPEETIVRFVPYGNTLGENYSYQFSVSVRSGRVKPSPQTEERLRVDVLARLAGRSNLQSFWQLLDLRR